jgi:hypothetical protein
MKRIYAVLLLAIVIVIALFVWFKFANSKSNKSPAVSQSGETNQPPNQPQPAIEPVSATVSLLEATVLPPDVFNPLAATNLDQWKTAMKGLKSSDIFYQNKEMWDVEQTNRRTGFPLMLIKGTQIVQYEATLVNINAKKPGGDLMEVQMQTPNMNIDETRELGVKLCNMMEVDPKDFQAWCDKVGNHWLDAPLYATNHYYGFGINRTYDNEKPWFINFIIEHP